MGRIIKNALIVMVVSVLFLLLIVSQVDAQYGDPPATPEPADLALMGTAMENILQSVSSTILPLLLGIVIGLGIVVMIMRYFRWL